MELPRQNDETNEYEDDYNTLRPDIAPNAIFILYRAGKERHAVTLALRPDRSHPLRLRRKPEISQWIVMSPDCCEIFFLSR